LEDVRKGRYKQERKTTFYEDNIRTGKREGTPKKPGKRLGGRIMKKCSRGTTKVRD